jgi:hypothetical protein
MTSETSPWVRRVVRAYILLVVAGALLGIVSGGLGGIFVLPLLLPWIAIVPLLEMSTGKPLLDMPAVGVLSVLASGTVNAYLLNVLLNFVDRRRKQKRDPTDTSQRQGGISR